METQLLRSPTVEGMLEAWHRAVGDTPGCATPEVEQLRFRLISEEYREVREEFEREPKDLAKLAKELGDLVYVCYGTAIAYGLPLERVIAEVHASNMTKLVGGTRYRADGKILKGPHFREADVESVLRRSYEDST